GPARVQAQTAVTAPPRSRLHPVRQGAREDKALVVVGELADQVHPAGGGPHPLGRAAEDLGKAIGRPHRVPSRPLPSLSLRALANAQASATIPARSVRVGFQPRTVRARSAEATRT